MKRESDPFGSTCESDGGGAGTYRRGMHECAGDTVPEEFWSCADVQITKNGTAAAPVQLVAGNFTAPPPEDSDEREAKVNPEDVTKRAQDEVKKDVEMTANESSGERKKEERAAAEGECLLEGEVCDGSLYCCDHSDVCVFRSAESRFRCTKWWSLWEEKDWRDAMSNGTRSDGHSNNGDDQVDASPSA